MKRSFIAPLSVGLLLAVALWAQAPQQPRQPQNQNQNLTPQPAAPEVPRTASISGSVIAMGTNEPIVGATVEIRRTDCSNFSNPPDVMTTTTDARGGFNFQKLREGGWCVVASIFNGKYMPAEYQQHSYKERGATLPILEGQSVSDIVLTMAPTGGISGRVMDRDAEPMSHARVQLLEPFYEDGRRKLFILQSVPTNDLGGYRFYWIPPGRYYVAVTPEPSGGRQTSAVIPQPGAGGRREETTAPVVVKKIEPNGSVSEETYFTVYYPGDPDPDHGLPIDLAPGADVGGIDFLLIRSRAQSFHVRGILTNGVTGDPAENTQVRLMPNEWRASVVMPSGTTDAKGNFDIAGVLPGSYVLYANMTYRPPDETGQAGAQNGRGGRGNAAPIAPTLPTAPTQGQRGNAQRGAPGNGGTNPPGPRGQNGQAGQTGQPNQAGQAARGAQGGQNGGQNGRGNAPTAIPISVRTPLTLGNADVEDLRLTLVMGFDLPGKARLEGVPEFPQGVNVSLVRDPDIVGAPTQGRGGAIQMDGTFTLNGVGPGDYRVLVTPFITNFQWSPASPPKGLEQTYVRSARYDGEDVLSSGLHLVSAVAAGSLELVFGKGGTVTGSVVNDRHDSLSNVLVALIPETQYRKRVDLYRTTSTDRLGRFKITGVAPGLYKAFAWETVERNQWQIPEFLQAVENRGLPVDVRESGETTADLTAISPTRP